MRKIIFIDIDGTLVTQAGTVPTSARLAIQMARQKGHQVYLATGRSKAEITEDISEIGFDGMIGAGGSYLEVNGEVIFHQKMNPQSVQEFMSYFNEREIGCYLESNQGLFANAYCIDSIKTASRRLFESRAELFVNQEDPEPHWFYEILSQSLNLDIPLHDINKLSFISNDFPFSEVYKEFHSQYEVYPTTVFEFGPQSGEIGLKGADKKRAIQILLKHLGTPAMTYAYGDGLNDIAMFEAVDYCVAMENGHEKLKAIANEICGAAEDDGLYQNFKKNQLI